MKEYLDWLIVWNMLVMVQFMFSCIDGYGFPWQLNGRPHYCFAGHGGMWADLFFVSPATAYVQTYCDLSYVSWTSLFIAVGALTAVGYMLMIYRKWCCDSHAHDGKITWAGWLHAVYAAPTFWILGVFYLGDRQATADLIGVSLALTPWCVLGPVKFSRHWSWKRGDVSQVAIMLVAIWGVTLFRL